MFFSSTISIVFIFRIPRSFLNSLSLHPLHPSLSCVHAYSVASVVPNSLQPHGLQPTRLLRPWGSPGKNTGVGCHFLPQRSSPPRDRAGVSCVSCTGGWAITTNATWGACLYHSHWIPLLANFHICCLLLESVELVLSGSKVTWTLHSTLIL